MMKFKLCKILKISKKIHLLNECYHETQTKQHLSFHDAEFVEMLFRLYEEVIYYSMAI